MEKPPIRSQWTPKTESKISVEEAAIKAVVTLKSYASIEEDSLVGTTSVTDDKKP